MLQQIVAYLSQSALVTLEQRVNPLAKLFGDTVVRP